MAAHYSQAIVSRISPSLKALEDFDFDRAKMQHEAYVSLLREMGLDVIELPPDNNLPEGVFVENTAVVCNGVALITKSGNATRQRESDIMKIILKKELDIPVLEVQNENAQLNGGDVLFTGREFFVGLTDRTNEDGAKSVAVAFPEYPCTPIKTSGTKSLKYYVTVAGPGVLCVSNCKDSQDVLKRIERDASFSYRTLTVAEEDAANLVYVNGTLIHRSMKEIPKSHKIIKEKVGIPRRSVDISEISKFSSGLTSFSILLR